jgi:cell division protein FtsW
VIKPVFALGLMGLLLLMEPDFGATVVMFMTALGMMFMAGARLRWFYLLMIFCMKG